MPPDENHSTESIPGFLPFRVPRRGRLFTHLSASLLAVLFVVGLQQFPLDHLNGFFGDLQFRLRLFPRPVSDIVLIAYDDRSAERYYGSTTFPAEEIANVFESLETEKPLAVAFLGAIDEDLYSAPEIQMIEESFQRVPKTLVGYTDDDSLNQLPLKPVLTTVAFYPGFVSRDTFSYGADSVSRRAMITLGGQPTLYAELARLYHNTETLFPINHAHRSAEGSALQVYINWQGPPGTYPTYTTEQVTRKQFKAGTFKNKIVLLGSKLSAHAKSDYISTPYARGAKTTSLLEGAAHSLGTLIRNDAVFRSPAWLNWLVNISVALLTVNIVLFFSPVVGILSVIAEVVVLFSLSWLALVLFQCWTDFAHPFLIACFGYYLVIPYRLVNEYRQRWHYQQKSELMAQLEQLKSNFLSLVSHDLKTPIARIQGNAELLLSNPSVQEGKDAKLVQAIINTAENLGQHVETILDLARIESAEIPLHRTSKDINATILEVIESRKALALEKQIEIRTSLEPLFAFKFDIRLMRRVLANLVENAIKYSPEGSIIELRSSEEQDWIRVSVVDQGNGIAPEEQERIFTKFYRGSDPATQKEKGTGLGLYLVKYFVELHNGFVELQSEQGKGSTFTVALPT